MQTRPRFDYVLYRAFTGRFCSLASYYDALTKIYLQISTGLHGPYNDTVW